MKKQTQLLSALALSVGLTLSASFQAVASIPGQVADQAPLPSLAPMLEKVLPAVVSVRVEGTASQGQKIPEEFKKFFGDDLPDQPAQPFEGLGSGVIINASKGYVLTNNHVINQAQKISIQLNDGREFDAKLIGSDDQSSVGSADGQPKAGPQSSGGVNEDVVILPPGGIQHGPDLVDGQTGGQGHRGSE